MNYRDFKPTSETEHRMDCLVEHAGFIILGHEPENPYYRFNDWVMDDSPTIPSTPSLN
jgi:hypothetical protein